MIPNWILEPVESGTSFTAKPNALPLILPAASIATAGVVVPIPSLLFTSSYAEVPNRILPFVALVVDDNVRLFPLAVPPITD